MDEKLQYVSIIRQNNDLLLQLISDILDISKIESGIIDTSLEVVDMNSMCQEIVMSNAIKTGDSVELLFESNHAQCFVKSDKTRLNQIISNLVGNAIKFTPSGTIVIGYHIDKDKIRFYVRDTGLGIAGNQIPSIFTRFVKLNSFIHGSGLGLPICKSLVNKLGGEIWVESQQGEGSCFWFTLPYDGQDADFTNSVILEPATPAAESGLSQNSQDDKPLILIAEDTDSNYLLISTILKKQYRLVRANNGMEAVNLFNEIKPDIVLMDMRMPIMDGMEATKSIREHDKTTPIIAVTAFAFDSDRENAINVGCSDFASKPINPDELRAMIKKHLDTRKK